MDYMKGPFLLPNNVKENDYIELGQLGAYGLTLELNLMVSFLMKFMKLRTVQ